MDLLRRVWLQQYPPTGRGRARPLAEGRRPPAWRAADRLADPKARCGVKCELAWIGYKAHLTEDCDDDRPHLVTNVETTPAATTDVELTAASHAALAERDLLPSEHLLDTSYLAGKLLVSSRADHGVDLVGPMPEDISRQAMAKHGFAFADFAIDWAAEQVTCPSGRTSYI